MLVKEISRAGLINDLRRVSLLTRPEFFPYKYAFITIEQISTDSLFPAQRYVLRDNLQHIQALRWNIREACGEDILSLNKLRCGYLEIAEDSAAAERGEIIHLLPSIVEESIEANGQVVPLINDGMHRLYIAHMEGIIPTVIYIRGVPKETPYYAFPLQSGWNGVSIIDKLEEGYVKKWYRQANFRDLYRNFNSAFKNVGQVRSINQTK